MKKIKHFKGFVQSIIERSALRENVSGSEEIITRFGVCMPDGHYGFPDMFLSKEFVFPKSDSELLDKNAEANYSTLAQWPDPVTEHERMEIFKEYGYYDVYRKIFILQGTKKALENIEDQAAEFMEDINDTDYGIDHFNLDSFKKNLQDNEYTKSSLEGLKLVISVDPNTGEWRVLFGEDLGSDDETIEKIADYIISDNMAASVVSKLRKSNPDNPILTAINKKVNSDIFSTLGDLGDLGF